MAPAAKPGLIRLNLGMCGLVSGPPKMCCRMQVRRAHRQFVAGPLIGAEAALIMNC
jgi:hypothetical protein